METVGGEDLNEDDQAIQYGKNGQQAARTAYSWESQEQKLIKLYKSL